MKGKGLKMTTQIQPSTGHTQAPPIAVAIVEDSAGIRENLAAFLNRAPGYRCVGAYPDAESALSRLKSEPAEVVLMDINLPGKSGIEATRSLKGSNPDARIVMLTVYEESKALFESLKAGACGYLLKRTPPEKILEAIRDARAGGVPLNPQMAAKVANYFQQLHDEKNDLTSLSPRERQTLELLAEGYLYKEIADRLGVSPGTVHQFSKRIYEKLHVRSRTEAVVKFLKQG
jgi:RNA polymerase sigma factor (sigma-70 family)